MQFISIVLLVAAAAVQGKTSVAERGFTSLFNGKDLTGWKIGGPPESFTVSDGAIVASGPASHAYYDGPLQAHRFRNFELRVDLDDAIVKDDEWFTLAITVQNDTIQVSVNDAQVVKWRQTADWDGGREGPGRKITGPGTIALQAHDAKSAVLYRNIRIKVLD